MKVFIVIREETDTLTGVIFYNLNTARIFDNSRKANMFMITEIEKEDNRKYSYDIIEKDLE